MALGCSLPTVVPQSMGWRQQWSRQSRTLRWRKTSSPVGVVPEREVKSVLEDIPKFDLCWLSLKWPFFKAVRCSWRLLQRKELATQQAKTYLAEAAVQKAQEEIWLHTKRMKYLIFSTNQLKGNFIGSFHISDNYNRSNISYIYMYKCYSCSGN